MADTRDQIFVAVGDALDAWSHIERILAHLFSVLADIQVPPGIHPLQKASVIFDTIISFKTRLDVVDALMADEGLDELEMEMWLRCSAKISNFHKQRHPLAHFSLIHVSDAGEEGFVLCPFLTPGKFMAGATDRIPLREIVERRNRFNEMKEVLTTYFLFGAERRRRGQPQGRPTPEPSLLRQLRASAVQSLEERARKQKPSPQK